GRPPPASARRAIPAAPERRLDALPRRPRVLAFPALAQLRLGAVPVAVREAAVAAHLVAAAIGGLDVLVADAAARVVRLVVLAKLVVEVGEAAPARGRVAAHRHAGHRPRRRAARGR